MRLPPAIGRYRTRGLLGTGSFATVVLADDDALETLRRDQAAGRELEPRSRRPGAVRAGGEDPPPHRQSPADPGARHRRVRAAAATSSWTSRRAARCRRGSTRCGRRTGLPLPDDVVLTLAGELAGCIGAAHSFGVIHRDVKPSNLLVRPARVSGGASGGPACGVGARSPPTKSSCSPTSASHATVLAGSGVVGWCRDARLHGTRAGRARPTGRRADRRVRLHGHPGVGAHRCVTGGDRRPGTTCSACFAGLDASGRRGARARCSRTIVDERPRQADEWLEVVESSCCRANVGARASSSIDRDATLRRGSPVACASAPGSDDRSRPRGRRASTACGRSARSGERGALLFAGEAGIGKTRMLAELAAEAAGRGAVVLAGRGDEPARAHLRSAGRRVAVAPEWRAAECAGRPRPVLDAGHLALVIPELAEFVDVPPADIHPDASRRTARWTPSTGCSPRSVTALRSCSSPTISMSPTLRRSACCGTSSGRIGPEPFLLLGAYRDTEVGAGASADGALRRSASASARRCESSSPVSTMLRSESSSPGTPAPRRRHRWCSRCDSRRVATRSSSRRS